MTITIRNSRFLAIGLGTKYTARDLGETARADVISGSRVRVCQQRVWSMVQRAPFLDAKVYDKYGALGVGFKLNDRQKDDLEAADEILCLELVIFRAP